MANPTGKGLKPENKWKPGQSGNPGGRYTDKPFMDEVRKALRKGGDGQDLRKIAEKLIKLAISGKQWAVELLCERLDGKTPVDVRITRDVREMSLNEILGELAEVRELARRTGSEDSGTGPVGSVH